jgi:hypothetical protein
MNHLRDVLGLWARSTVDAGLYQLRHVLPRWRELERTRRLRGTKQDRRALVFASGPSMRKLDPAKVRALQGDGGFDVIGLNAYAATEFGRIAPPDLYVLTDPATWTRALTDDQVKHLDPAGQAAARAKFATLVDELWRGLEVRNPKLFIPVELYPQRAYENAYPFCSVGNLFTSNVIDITRPQALRPMTAYRALAIACYLGYREIYFCGIDNDAFKSTTVDEANVKWCTYEHFYDVEPERIPSYESLSRGLYYTSLTFGCLENYRGFPIVNLDPAGLVDVFPKQHDLAIYR